MKKNSFENKLLTQIMLIIYMIGLFFYGVYLDIRHQISIIRLNNARYQSKKAKERAAIARARSEEVTDLRRRLEKINNETSDSERQ